MRSFVLPLLALLAGCAHPASQAAAPMPMAAGCPMMHGGAPHAMAGMPMAGMPMAGMAMAAPSDSSAAHKCPCPMHATGHSMSHMAGTPAPAGADSTRAMAGCPMCAGGQCPMHSATPPDTGTPTH